MASLDIGAAWYTARPCRCNAATGVQKAAERLKGTCPSSVEDGKTGENSKLPFRSAEGDYQDNPYINTKGTPAMPS